MQNIELYTKLLRTRTILKKVQQWSWVLSKMEQKYDMDMLSDDDMVTVLDTYKGMSQDFEKILVELRDEYVETANTNKD